VIRSTAAAARSPSSALPARDCLSRLTLMTALMALRGHTTPKLGRGQRSRRITIPRQPAGAAAINDGPAPITHPLVYASAASWIGASGVTSSTGFPVPATTPVVVPLTGAEEISLYAVTSSSATVSYFLVT
jgi:hypothetical protein